MMKQSNDLTAGLVIMVVSLAFGAPRTLGQASFVEEFEDITNPSGPDHGPPQLIDLRQSIH